jgi:hypothetical protein
MITPDQFNAAVAADPESAGGPHALTEGEQLLLENLVKNYSVYQQLKPMFPDLPAKIDAEQLAPSAITWFLKAVLTALNELPPVNAESQGTDKSPGFFSAKTNWGELAQDVLNQFYDSPQAAAHRSYVVFQRRIQDIALRDSSILRSDKTGRIY